MEKERQHNESLLDQQRLDVLQQQELNRKLQSEKQEHELNEKRVTGAVELNKKKLESQTIEQEIENKSKWAGAVAPIYLCSVVVQSFFVVLQFK